MLACKCKGRSHLEGVNAVLALYILAAVLLSHWIDKLVTFAVCNDFHLNITSCNELLEFSPEESDNKSLAVSHNFSHEDMKLSEDLQNSLRDWKFYLWLSSSCVSLISAVSMGFWSDQLGRRRPILLCCGVTLVVLSVLVICTFTGSVPPWTFLLLSSVASLGSPTVFLLLALASVANSTSGRHRLEEFVAMTALLTTFKALGGVIGAIPSEVDGDSPLILLVYAVSLVCVTLTIRRAYQEVEKDGHMIDKNSSNQQAKWSQVLLAVLLLLSAAFYFCNAGSDGNT